DVHRQALVLGIEARALGDGPALQDALQLQAEIVVEPGGRVLLNDEDALALAGLVRDLARGLGRFLEVALASILAQAHHINPSTDRPGRLPGRGVTEPPA